ncbi:DUF6036 family nucleotidyltransferase [Paenibacillus sp. Root444D2]|uniref:DUF6036 family nucleotidyltransferase n=1 Tax=Paenibacillus sp. Root444D2 TaxID=1736538 RepID=UPI0007089E84|nr:DUF6036 family nucleotidyltransferase [Paenibacillus sp. Root444D2]KQX51934.1 hypothetical protein ASD40_07640 [Paenibacillus sp. Root444D2]
MDLINLFDKDDGLAKEDILSRLEMFAKELRQGTTVIVIGAASIILTIDSERKTTNVDIFNTTRVASYLKYDIQIINEDILFLCEDYRNRLILKANFEGILVYTLGLLDVALIKLGRGLDKDIEDIKEILQSGVVSIEQFKFKYKEFRYGYGGSFEILDNNYWAVVGEKFISNDRMF